MEYVYLEISGYLRASRSLLKHGFSLYLVQMIRLILALAPGSSIFLAALPFLEFGELGFTGRLIK